MHYVSCVAAEGAEESTVAVHDDETELLVGFEELAQSFCVEFVVAEVEGRVDWFEGFEIYIDLPLLPLRGDYLTAVDDQAVWRNFVV